jgi:hypothetical protein
MEKHQQLQQRINEILYPNIEDRLTFGCEIYDKYEKETLTITKPNYNNDKLRVKIQNNGLLDFNFGKIDCEILGLPINLEMILIALKTNKNHCSIDCSMIDHYVRINLFVEHKKIIICYLFKPFNEQSKETQEALYKLFNIKQL